MSIKAVRDDGNLSGHDTLVIVLSAVFGFIGLALLIIGGIWCVRARRRRVFNRGITPIGDEEIASWKVPQGDEKEFEVERYTARPSHASKGSTSSTKRATTIQYSGRPSADVAASSRSFVSHKYSMEFPLSPPEAIAVVARAPNARSGLTDESVPGDDPFITLPRRQPSRLQKIPPSTPGTPRSRSNSMKSHTGAWPGSNAEYGVGHSRMYSTSSMPPLPSRSENEVYTDSSPLPSHMIGQAIG
ncbi:hypothetical protein F5Y18DRAFT_426837 [Xylariaceae sp. FL1019]|nr:hypothetical protein F5Y18DRAFT_426837 [Xylariaceae sp. FL1019]